MEYPVYIDGKKKGTLFISPEGIYTRITAKCEKCDGVVRLSLFGEGKSAYLGVLCPENGMLVFSKSFSKNEMQRFPEKIEYAANCALQDERGSDADITWIMSTNGCLVAETESGKLVAIPADPEKIAGRGVLREILGRYYLIFRK